MSFLGIYRAVYSYQPQSAEEVEINENDLLYLLEKSDIDDWWKVKRRVDGDDAEEPIGLVPYNYIEPAPIKDSAHALYDYEKQTEEEVGFKEGDKFDVYDTSDPDWYLVGLNQQFGFIPSNYVEIGASGASIPHVQQPQPTQMVGTPLNFPPPPQHKDRGSITPETEIPLPEPPHVQQQQQQQHQRQYSYEDSPELRPAMPSRPTTDLDLDDAPPAQPQRPRASSNAATFEEPEDLEPEHKFDGESFTWFIHELEGRKKRKVELSIGSGRITLNRKGRKTDDIQEWPIKDLLQFSNEKKHVFFELKNPRTSLELHAGKTDVADAIIAIVGDLKGAFDSTGLKEVAKASKPSKSSHRTGKLIYDFDAQSRDELNCREGDLVYIINDTKSKDWWMCQNIDTGDEGVVPASYVEIVGSSGLSSFLTGSSPSKKKSSSSSNRSKEKDSPSKSRRLSFLGGGRDKKEREKIRARDEERRKKEKVVEQEDATKPNPHRVRTWIDSSGTFKVEAEFLKMSGEAIQLFKTNGVKISVKLTKLSLEDVNYVELVTGVNLERYREEVIKQTEAMKKKAEASQRKSELGPSAGAATIGMSKSPSATAIINDIAPPKPTRPKTTTAITKDSPLPLEPDDKWFDFFLETGVAVANAQRYALSFTRESMDVSILEEITPTLLRTIGLREGDIIRVTKFLDKKFDRKKESSPSGGAEGGLFTESSGALKNNRTTTQVPKIEASALPSSKPATQSFEDDAWAVKPAAKSNEDLSKPNNPTPNPQFTGSMQDLVNIKPLEPNSTSNSIQREVTPAQPVATNPSAPALQPIKTGTLIQPGQQFAVQKTGSNNAAAQPTGGLIPVQPTGFIPIQPTGFIPIQPTGFIPIQQTGALTAQPTFGFVPLQNGTMTLQKTGGAIIPQTTFGQLPLQPTGFVPLQTGLMTLQKTGGATPVPTTSFGQQPLQPTGGFIPLQRTGGVALPSTSFNQLPSQITGGFISMQRTGGFIPVQQTGGVSALPPTSFGQMPFQQPVSQPNGGLLPLQKTGTSLFPQPTFGVPQQQLNSFPTTTFGQQPLAPQQTFGNPAFNQSLPNLNSFNPQQSAFGQQQFISQQPTFMQNGLSQQPTNFAPNGFSQQPNMNQLSNMFQNTNLNNFGNNGFAQQPQFGSGFGSNSFTTFGQPPPSTFNSFGQQPVQQPLQSQPTGAGFGNAPLSGFGNQDASRKANLNAATADNPFGF